MRNNKYINQLKEELIQYGNLTIQELLIKIGKEEELISSMENIRVKWKTYYGSGSNELCGERYERSGRIKDLLEDILRNKIQLMSLSDLDEEYIDDIIIFDTLAEGLYEGIYIKGHVGNPWMREIEIEFVDEKPDEHIFKKYIYRLRNEKYWEYEKIEHYFR